MVLACAKLVMMLDFLSVLVPCHIVARVILAVARRLLKQQLFSIKHEKSVIVTFN